MGAGDTVSSEMVRRFRLDGCLHIPGLLVEDEIQQLQDVYLSAEDQSELWSKPMRDEGRPASPQDQLRTELDTMFRRTFNLRFAFPELNAVVRRLGGLAARLIGEDEVKIWWDQVFIKPPFTEGTRPTVWHQDQPFWPFDRRGALTFWIAVEDLGPEQGTLRFVPRSHRLGSLGMLDFSSHEPPLDELLLSEDFEMVRAVVGGDAMSAGDASVHDASTLHGAGENDSDRPRRGWAITFFPGSALYTGAPNPNVDGTGTKPKSRFTHHKFALPED